MEVNPKIKALKEDMGLLLSTREAARYIGLSEKKFRELVHMKDSPIPTLYIPHVSYPKYSKESLDRYVDEIDCQVRGVLHI